MKSNCITGPPFSQAVNIPPGAGGSRRLFADVAAWALRYGGDDETDAAARHAAIRAAVPQRGQSLLYSGAQTANACFYLGSRHVWRPKTERQAVVASIAAQPHGPGCANARHPYIRSGPRSYYRTTPAAPKKNPDEFWYQRVPKYLGYFEGLLKVQWQRRHSGGRIP